MTPSLMVRIEILEDVKLELLGRAIRGLNVTDELKVVNEKLKKYGKLRRENKKKRKKRK